LPAPGPGQLRALNKLLNNVSSDYGMTKEDLDLRFQVFSDIKSLFETKIKGMFDDAQIIQNLGNSEVDLWKILGQLIDWVEGIISKFVKSQN
jgi:hypothetical protein